LEQGILI